MNGRGHKAAAHCSCCRPLIALAYSFAARPSGAPFFSVMSGTRQVAVLLSSAGFGCLAGLPTGRIMKRRMAVVEIRGTVTAVALASFPHFPTGWACPRHMPGTGDRFRIAREGRQGVGKGMMAAGDEGGRASHLAEQPRGRTGKEFLLVPAFGGVSLGSLPRSVGSMGYSSVGCPIAIREMTIGLARCFLPQVIAVCVYRSCEPAACLPESQLYEFLDTAYSLAHPPPHANQMPSPLRVSVDALRASWALPIPGGLAQSSSLSLQCHRDS